MKKMLLTAAIAATFGAFAQVPATRMNGRALNAGQLISTKYEPAVQKSSTRAEGPQQQAKLSKTNSAPTAWQVITQSMNAYGNVEENVRPLQYHDELNIVSFVHRRSPFYIPNPFPVTDAESGVIVGVFTNDWGLSWDTTLLWNSDVHWGRYPQGGIHNPRNNCMIEQAVMVAAGPITGATGGWMGSYFANKLLDKIGGAGNSDTMNGIFGSSIFINNTGPFPYGKFDYPSLDFASTNDGRVRFLGYLADDINGSTAAQFGWQGASVITGQYIPPGVFAWDVDTIIPDIFVSPDNTKQVFSTPHMAWNESGSVGYVWFIGVRNPRVGQGDTLSNMGFQPIVYKTTDSGFTWTELPRINFNDPSFKPVMDQLISVQGDSMGIPFFNPLEWIDGIVDRNDRLHIVSTVFGTFSKNPDSLGFIYSIPHNDGESYRFGHRPGLRPYIFDFTETPTGWMPTLIDSMSSEAPGVNPGDAGVNENPWDATGGTSGNQKIQNGARIQLSRTADGKFILYTFAESDTGFTSQGRKWNQFPNVKARLAEIGAEVGSTPGSISIHTMEINITKPSSPADPPFTVAVKVSDRATLHHIATKMGQTGPTSFALPITVTNNSFVPMQQLNTVDHHYLSANLKFESTDVLKWPVTCTTVGIPEEIAGISASLYPNPARETVQVVFNANIGQGTIQILNMAGQQMINQAISTIDGLNEYSLRTSGLPPGIYIVQLTVPGGKRTAKLVIE